MSGHSKWSTIKRKKGAADAKRSKIFTKLIKEISVAVKNGGPDPDANPRLRLAIQNAKGVSMPKDNIARALQKGSEKGGADYANMRFEGYGQGGVAFMVECSSDNNNRTVANVRSYFAKCGGNLGTLGSVEFMFDHKSVFELPPGNLDIETLTLEMIEAGADDIEENEDGTATIYAAMQEFGAIQKKLEELKLEATSATLEWLPKTTTPVDAETAKQVLKLIDMLEDDDDVNNVHHNMELSDEIAEMLG
jgi:YebC/PmpR family DNA-binding regulatory protein